MRFVPDEIDKPDWALDVSTVPKFYFLPSTCISGITILAAIVMQLSVSKE
jgi:hypothetical protein